MIPFSDALKTVLEQASFQGREEEVPLMEAFGRVLARDASAAEPIPVADNSAMDGYAVRAADLSGEGERGPLEVVAVLAANSSTSRTLQPGQAMKIMTGAPIPPGADAVVMVEFTRQEAEQVWVSKPVAAGDHVRAAGGDMQPGQVVLQAGQRLTPAQVGMLAALGLERVPVRPRPRVGILATGDEIIPPAEALAPGKVRNANSYSLAGLVLEAGAEPVVLGIAPDDPEALKTALEEGLAGHDLLITSGGVSMGDFDYVKRLVDEIGLEVFFRAINIKPGKPVVFGSREGRLFFGLPGNPVSSMVTFLRLVRPALAKMLGETGAGWRRVTATLAEPLDKQDGKRHFLRAIVSGSPEGGLIARLTGDQGSGLLHSMGRANGLIVLDENTTQVPAGQTVEVELFDGAPFPEG